MEKNLFTVGEVSAITGVPKDTLRYYDRIGLFQPAIKNPETGYRYYSIDQFWYIDIITCFRKLGLSIQSIKKTLASKDNSQVVSALSEQRHTAQRHRDYYDRVLEDIDWYCEQNRRIARYRHVGDFRIEELPERNVICGFNSPGEQDYHIKLQENSRAELLHADSIKRSYGYVLDPAGLQENAFRVQGEYLSLGVSRYAHTAPQHILTIPGGQYACFITTVCKNRADFSPLLQWMAERGQTVAFVIADEVALQLFYYNQYSYPCEIKAYLGKLPAFP